MQIVNGKAEGVKIAYVGGGSKGWAWGLMKDLALAPDMSGTVALYDIDYEAAKRNEKIGNTANRRPGCLSKWSYKAHKTIDTALRGADFVIISIMPATYDEMEVHVHLPEKYGIYQSVGDTTGPGGIMRALLSIPMFEVIAKAIEKNCPEAWVINYTNPMTVCVRTLYRTFPKIKAFGCCHEVFGTQKLLAKALDDLLGIKDVARADIKVNVTGVNHFTWLTEATYKHIDLFPLYRQFVEKYKDGYGRSTDETWLKDHSRTASLVKFDLFKKYGYIAAAGDRHLAEFCPGNWYLGSKEIVDEYCFGLTPVSWRKAALDQWRTGESFKYASGEKKLDLKPSGEEGVLQMRAILGLTPDYVTNVNLPNNGQIPNLPKDAVVETNARFVSGQVTPVFAGDLPIEIYPLITRIVAEQEMVVDAALNRDLEKAFIAFANNPNVCLSLADARKLFDEMVEGTKAYLTEYFK